MKTFFALGVLLICSCNVHKTAAIEFEKEDALFAINQDDTFTTDFKFKNTGSDSLKIMSADASCGCTQVNYPKQGIAPGEEGIVHVVYDSKDNTDTVVVKSVLIESNTQPMLHTLKLKGTVKKS